MYRPNLHCRNTAVQLENCIYLPPPHFLNPGRRCEAKASETETGRNEKGKGEMYGERNLTG